MAALKRRSEEYKPPPRKIPPSSPEIRVPLLMECALLQASALKISQLGQNSLQILQSSLISNSNEKQALQSLLEFQSQQKEKAMRNNLPNKSAFRM